MELFAIDLSRLILQTAFQLPMLVLVQSMKRIVTISGKTMKEIFILATDTHGLTQTFTLSTRLRLSFAEACLTE